MNDGNNHMPFQPLVLLRCNAGHETGLGHVSRSLRLALALRERGARVHFLLGSDDAVERVRQAGFTVDVQPPDDDSSAFLDEIRRQKPLAVVLDVRPPYSRSVVCLLKEYTRVVILDDISEQRWEADLIYLPPTPAVLALDWTGFSGQRHIGIEWMLTGHAFTPCPLCPPHEPLRLLLTTGGSDPWGYMEQLAPALVQNCHELHIELGLVVGPSFRARQQQLVTYSQLFPPPRIFDAPSSMNEPYMWCDSAITVFCVSAYELAACGRPALYLCPSKEYAEHAAVFQRKGYGNILWTAGEGPFLWGKIRLVLPGFLRQIGNYRHALREFPRDAAPHIAMHILQCSPVG